MVRHKRLRPRDTEALPITILHYATKVMPASKGKCPQDTKSRAPPPSFSVTRPKSTTELLHQGGGVSSSPAQSVVASPHQVGGSHDESQGLLAAARLLSREFSQELIPITSTKHSHKCAYAYMMYNEALWWLQMIFGSCILPWSPATSNDLALGVYIATHPKLAVGKRLTKSLNAG